MIILRNKEFADNLEQREFNFVSDVYRSGLGRTLKRNIGRARVKLADKIDKNINERISNLYKTSEEALNNKTTRNRKVDRKLINYAKDKHNAKTFNFDLGSGSVNFNINETPKEGIKALGSYLGKKTASKLDKALLNKNENIILHKKKTGTALLAHEVGHLDNRTGSKLKKFIQKKGNGENPSRQLESPYASESKGLKDIVKHYINGKYVVAEEANATRNGLKLMKKMGASDKELKEAKEHLGKALQTYKDGAYINSRIPIRNTIQIPSRRANLTDPTKPSKIYGNPRINKF